MVTVSILWAENKAMRWLHPSSNYRKKGSAVIQLVSRFYSYLKLAFISLNSLKRLLISLSNKIILINKMKLWSMVLVVAFCFVGLFFFFLFFVGFWGFYLFCFSKNDNNTVLGRKPPKQKKLKPSINQMQNLLLPEPVILICHVFEVFLFFSLKIPVLWIRLW